MLRPLNDVSEASTQEAEWVHTKGQLISKWFFGVLDFLQKTNEQIRLHYYDTSTYFRLFFGGNRRHQKAISILSDLYNQLRTTRSGLSKLN